MSGVLHPVGPEPPLTYWVRRAAVLGVLVLLVALLIALAMAVFGRDHGSGSVAAVPAGSQTGALSSGGGTGSVDPTRDPTARSTGVTPTRRASTSPTAEKKAPAAAKTPACSPAALDTTLTGKEVLVPRQDDTFTLSLVNRARNSCVVTVTPKTFALTVYSGQDRIWSTKDCSSAVKATTTTVASGKAVTWKVRWNGLRSAPNCRNLTAVPKTGTYVATAQLAKAAPARMALVLTKRS